MWSELRKHLGEMTHPRLFIQGLGTFAVRPGKIDYYLIKYKNFLRTMNPKSFEEYSHKRTIEQHYERYQKIKELLLQEEHRKYEKIKVKKAYGVTKNMEQQEKDSGGDQEQSIQETGD